MIRANKAYSHSKCHAGSDSSLTFAGLFVSLCLIQPGNREKIPSATLPESVPTSTPITSADLKKGLEAKRFGAKVYTFETIDSTNNCARALAGCWATEGTLVIAEHQTAGKGRLGRQWLANPGENLTFSLVLRPTIGPEVVNLLPLYAAVALAETIEQTCGTKVECKWPMIC